MGACCEVRAHNTMWLTCGPRVRYQSSTSLDGPALRCTRRLQREALQLTWLVGLGTKAVVREYVRLTWVEL